ncbi:MAG TPA: LamG-like jellyroll fold domain-containing protein [Chitinophaga sp.]|uniref:Ig-like domain-containing protein n=1 Tax=Chitinophaga sp. TaxID=1869181 RepID=UPI002C4BAC10|nr:LamG-like jellyroll fold domain-containing protein [Chitinophaga sp.]HVI45154.1 LamG-like jellyroll fold domain-containing protein [Chitinophaga sp.]
MKTYLFTFKQALMLGIWLTLCIFITPTSVHAQKIYANRQTNKVNGLCLFCSVTNPENAVNSNLDDYAGFVINLGLLGVSIEETLIFPDTSTAGCDSLLIGIGSSNPILSVNLFGDVTVETYYGNIANNDTKVLTAGILRLLNNNTRAEVMLKPAARFDRVKVKLTSSLVGLLESFRLYYAFHQSLAPAAPAIAPAAPNICSGDTIQLTASASIGNAINWYSSATGGTPVATGNILKITPTTTTTYYAQADSNGCTSSRTAVTVTVKARPAAPSVIPAAPSICTGDSVALNATGTGIKWYNAAVEGTQLFNGNTYTVNPATTTTYYAQADSNGCTSSRTAVTVTAKARPAAPSVIPASPSICTGDSVTLNATGTGIKWYNAAVEGTLLYKGNTYPVNPATTTTYYAQADSNGCTSSRTAVTVTVNPVPGSPHAVNDSIFIDKGDTATLSVTSIPLFTILWYNAPQGGTLLFTGNDFRVSPVANTPYYAAYRSPAGCESRVRTQVWVLLLSPCSVAPLKPIAYYPMNGNTNDATPNGNNGIPSDISFANDSICKQAAIFNGTSSRIQLPATTTPTSEITFAAWINFSEFNSGFISPLIANGNAINAGKSGWVIGDSFGSLQIVFWTTNGRVNFRERVIQELNRWYHIAFTYDGSSYKVFINGVQVVSRTHTGNIVNGNASDYYLGYYEEVAAHRRGWFKGKMDEVYIYHRALSPAEIQQLYSSYAFPPTMSALTKQENPLPAPKIPGPQMIRRQLDFYPNPSNGEIRLKNTVDVNGSVITATDLKGKEVFRDILKANRFSLPPALPAGTYILRVITPKHIIFTGKVVINR